MEWSVKAPGKNLVFHEKEDVVRYKRELEEKIRKCPNCAIMDGVLFCFKKKQKSRLINLCLGCKELEN